MGPVLEPNPDLPVTILDLIQTSLTLCFRVPWVIGTTLLRRWWPWNQTYKPPPVREHLFRHVMTWYVAFIAYCRLDLTPR